MAVQGFLAAKGLMATTGLFTTDHGYMLAFLNNLGPWEMLVIGIVALLLFGKRLPEVGRSLGKGIVEFKKGLRDTGDDINTAGNDTGRAAKALDKPEEKTT